jgi:excisionase family DNA binding protein
LFKELLTVKEVAEMLQVSRRTVYNWIDEGVIRAVKVNDKDKSAVRIPSSEIGRIIREALLTPSTPLSDEKRDTIRSRY